MIKTLVGFVMIFLVAYLAFSFLFPEPKLLANFTVNLWTDLGYTIVKMVTCGIWSLVAYTLILDGARE